ncbi:circadian locomoter output cycles protein kaput isoform X2 [Anthonomus grandis grandis]|uniref:circadian locomoter output cycles protein kaput isoform X2 n=1 Tax=Anthonomus grandis grandis TaxID=2921223 RepID=UPI002164FB67|nr:circadian locomoter output cycles protein kaput isoform X2 [Anthonomus grandis grandis]
MKPNIPSYKKHHHSSKRSEKSRNLSEKKRRDQFNLLVNELSSMVSTSGRKMDKSTVLKSTISFLKNHNEIAVRSRINEIQEDWKPTFLTNEEFTHLVLDAVDGFIIVFSTSGPIYYASESITSLLGYLAKDVLNTTIFELANEEDQNGLYNILSQPNEDDGHVAFTCHIKCGGSKVACCELVQFEGYFRSDEDMVQTGDNKYCGTSAGDIDNRLLFVGTGRIQTPLLIKEMPLVDSSRTEFTSRHSLEWKFLFLDHRAPPIIGYLPFELLGTSGYEYYHVDDLERVIRCHESLMQKGEGTSCYYRFLTKGQQWIWLQTRYFITYHQWNSKPEFVVCTHRVISYLDVIKETRREQGVPPQELSPIEGKEASSNPWKATNKKSSKRGPDSDCTSMSADSPTSRQSVMTEQSAKSRVSQSLTGSTLQSISPSPQQQQPEPNTRQQSTHIQQQQQHQQNSQFLEPNQYVASIPLQPVITGYPAHQAVLSPLPVENVISPVQIQVDLQRKQAELQAIIGHQQQELRRVSEQLLMARLGLFGQQPQQQQQSDPVQSYQQNSLSTVSSTTEPVPILSNAVTGPPSVIVPVTVPISVAVSSHQPTVLYDSTPDSNTHLN